MFSTRTGAVRNLRLNVSTSPGRMITSHLPSRQVPSLVPFFAFNRLPGVCFVVGNVGVGVGVGVGLWLVALADGVALAVGLALAERDGVPADGVPDDEPPLEQPAATSTSASTGRS